MISIFYRKELCIMNIFSMYIKDDISKVKEAVNCNIEGYTYSDQECWVETYNGKC